MKERLKKLNPPPIGPMPFLIGGGGEKVTLRLVAKHADMWHIFGDLDTYLRKSEILAEHCAKVGRDPATIEHVIGSFQNTLAVADDLADAGVSELTIRIGGPDYDLGELREAIQWRDRRNAG
jgi:alkanesulfonate monooxygenase SsuD/methylene tetrahydromethanopterin reductase-like flavin-dependent oxidoreductase (luciferase family)